VRKRNYIITHAQSGVAPTIYRMQGRAPFEESDTEGARIALDAALVLAPTDVPTFFARGQASLTIGGGPTMLCTSTPAKPMFSCT
jgi:hypothetical protein